MEAKKANGHHRTRIVVLEQAQQAMCDIHRQSSCNDERDLLARAASWSGCPSLMDLTEETVRRIAAKHGTDFATALIFDRLVRSPRHRPFIEEVDDMPEHGKIAGPLPTVAIVPGAFYREDSTTGANGRAVQDGLQALGCRTEIVPLLSFGPIAENAAILTRWLANRPRDEELVLVSISKATAEVKVALASPGSEWTFQNVTTWISLSGVYHGTPLVTWLLRQRWRLPLIRLLFLIRGWHFGAIGELERGRGMQLDFEPRLPQHLRIIHLIGFPRAQDLTTPLIRRGYRRIAHWGPNDGGPNLLADVVRLPGNVYPVWGADHYLRPVWDTRFLLGRLLRWSISTTAAQPLCRRKTSL